MGQEMLKGMAMDRHNKKRISKGKSKSGEIVIEEKFVCKAIRLFSPLSFVAHTLSVLSNVQQLRQFSIDFCSFSRYCLCLHCSHILKVQFSLSLFPFTLL